MERELPLSTGLGEVMAPHTLVTALIVSPEGEAKVDPGALHGRSELESRLTMVQKREQVGQGSLYRIVWVAIELDTANQPVRYKGVSVCELFVNTQTRCGYKSLAESVNRMAEAMRGGANVSRLTPQTRVSVKQHLIVIGRELWERSAESLKQALES